MTTLNTLKILSLEAENLKRLTAVHITPDPDGHLVVISGRNGQGKTSVLDSIEFALAGTGAQRDTPQPIRHGEDHASVALDLGDLRVRREWKGERQTLTVTAKDGARYSSPQRMLDEFIGRLSFDPLAYSQLSDREQLAQLLDLVELPFDPAKVDAERRAVYDERAMIKRDVKRYEAQLDALPEPENGLPDSEVQADEVDLNEVIAAMQRGQLAHNRHQQLLAAHNEAAGKVEALRRQLAEAEAVLAEFPVPDSSALPDMDALRAAVAATQEANRQARQRADDTNRRVRDAAEYRRQADLLRQAREAADDLTQRLAAIDKRKTDALSAARMPIDGLAFDQDGVTYQGVPFRQCSAAERLRVSLAMAMALNPKLRVIRITDGSLLDSDNMRLIQDMAAENDFQCWIERVDESGTVGFMIEDGSVKA